MSKPFQIQTQRVLLRQWQETDYPRFAQMSNDPQVMEFFPELLTAEKSNRLVDKFSSIINQLGWGFWAAERLDDGAFLGIIGLNQIHDLPIDNSIEVGWRLAREHWGQGYAMEAASAALCFAFKELDQPHVIAITSVINRRSRQLMTRLGMGDCKQNFQHPGVAEPSKLREHVLYKIERDAFQSIRCG